MRAGIIPFYVAYIFANRREDIIVYFANKEIQLDADIVVNMCEQADDYAIYISKEDLQKEKYIRELIITLIGNFIGTFFVGFILKYTRIYTMISEKAKTLADIKLNDTLISILILSFFCGILMYLAVNTYKEVKDIGKYLAVFLGVIVFILCGFEHCIANMYYFSVSSTWSLNTLLYLLIMILGNSLGGILIPLCNKVIKKG